MSTDEPPIELTEAALAEATRQYYDGRSVIGDAWDGEPVGDLPDVTAEKRRLEDALRAVVQGRRALEVACGTGDKTRIAAAVAEGIVAIDASETCIRLARDGCSLPHVTFQVGDAFDRSPLPGDFTAGFAGGFFHLVPKRRHGEFLQAFHSRLRPGSPIFLCASLTRTLRGKKRLFRHPGAADAFCNRQLKDGRSFVIVNNDFDERDLGQIFGPVGRDLRIEVGDAWWWVTYSI